MQSSAERISRITAINHYAAGYRHPVEALSNIFFIGEHQSFTPIFIAKAKATSCADVASMTDEDWVTFLASSNQDPQTIVPLSKIQPRPQGQNLQPLLQKYAQNPNHKNHNFYQALAAITQDYSLDKDYASNLYQIINIDSNNDADKTQALKMFDDAYRKMAKMSELESKLNMIAVYEKISDPLYQAITTSMLKAQTDVLKQAPALKNLLREYLDNKSDALIALAVDGKALSKFYITLNNELSLISQCGSDPQLLEKTLKFLTDNIDTQDAQNTNYREQAAIQHIQKIAEHSKKLNTNTLFHGQIKPGHERDLSNLMTFQFIGIFSLNALTSFLSLQNQNIDTFKLFPGKPLSQILEEGAKETPNATIGQILENYIANNPEAGDYFNRKIIAKHQGMLATIADIHKIPLERTKILFAQALNPNHTQPSMKPDLAYIRQTEWHHSSLDSAVTYFTTVQQQLTQLFQNHPQLSAYLKTYIDTQKYMLQQMEKEQNITGLQRYAQNINVVTAIGTIIATDPQAGKQLKRTQTRGVVLLAEKLQALHREDPKKSAAIQQALTAVLVQDPEMTFDKLVAEMTFNENKASPMGKLKTAMGAHRGLFSKIASFFYSFDTKTIKLFKEKIQQQKNLSNEDMGFDSENVKKPDM